ncbi:MAG: glycosyltransferase family 4 protein, partial [Acidiferrobacterales bacterium]|nr:glycosyltransferase family 4 protein [Acidiferrobacterales bacterium]
HVCDHGYAHLLRALGRRNSVQSTAAINVVTLHDLIPYLTWRGKIPSNVSVKKPSLNMYSLSFVKHYDRIICVSQSSADDAAEILKIEHDRIAVVPPIIADHFVPKSREEVFEFAQRYLPQCDAKWVLISGREHYKNIGTSLRVIRQLIDQGESIRVVRTGTPNQEFNKLVADFGLTERVSSIFLPRHKDLAKLYCAVDCLLFPSWYEGFGMPVVEALACGTPVVASNVASLPEAGGALALMSAPDDIDSLCNQVQVALNNDAHQQMVKKNGLKWAEQFRASEVANRLIQIYNV